MKQERTGGSHSIGSRFICRINVEKVFLMADNSGPIVISETYCRWTSYIIPEASTQPTKRILSLSLPLSCLSCSTLFRLLPRNSPCFSARLIGHGRVLFVLSSHRDLYFFPLFRPPLIHSRSVLLFPREPTSPLLCTARLSPNAHLLEPLKSILL